MFQVPMEFLDEFSLVLLTLLGCIHCSWGAKDRELLCGGKCSENFDLQLHSILAFAAVDTHTKLFGLAGA